MNCKFRKTRTINFTAVSSMTLMAFLMVLPLVTWAQNMPAAAQSCTACHGPNGQSNNPMWPNLAGQKKDYLIKQLNDFRSGARKDPLMTPMAQTIKESDIADLAQFFSSVGSVK